MNPPPNKTKKPEPIGAGAPMDIGLIAETPLRRRGFFGVFSAGAAVAGLAQVAMPAAAAERLQKIIHGNSLMLEKLTHDVFAEHIGDAFHLEIGHGQSTQVKLASVTPLGEMVPERRLPFSLLFAAPANAALSQRIYSLSHSELGSMQVFLVPIQKDSKGLILEAVFT